MQFKNFVWPCNPAKLEITSCRNLKIFQLPYNGEAVQDLGRAGRRITGSGVFYGSGALSSCHTLEGLLHGGAPGLLTLPGEAAFTAHFCSFSYRREATPDYFSYTFEFREVA